MNNGRTNKTGAVVIGGDFQGLGVIRSLAENEVPIFLIETERSIGKYSKYVKRTDKNHSLLNDDNFSDYLICLAKRENLKGWVLFPNNDECVKLLSIHKRSLDEWYRNPAPPWEVAKNFYYKKNAYEICKKNSLPMPLFYEGSCLGDFLSQDIQFPVVLKPSCKEGYFVKTKKKAMRIDNLEDFKREYSKMADLIGTERIVVQEMIEGGTKNLYSLAVLFDGKKILQSVAAKRLRQHPMDFGQATTYAKTVDGRELEGPTEKILRAIGFEGLAEVEFMKDEKTRTFKFIEINGRPWGWHTLGKAAGVNLVFALFRHMTGRPVARRQPEENVKWLRLITDIPTAMNEIRSGRMKIKEYMESLNGNREFAVFSLRDPMPFFAEVALSPYLFKKRGF